MSASPVSGWPCLCSHASLNRHIFFLRAVFFQGQVPTQFVKVWMGRPRPPSFSIWAARTYLGKPVSFSSHFGAEAAPDRFQHQPLHCPSQALRPIASDAEDGGHAPLGTISGVIGLSLVPLSSRSILNRIVETATRGNPHSSGMLCSNLCPSVLVNPARRRLCPRSASSVHQPGTRVCRAAQKNCSKEGQPAAKDTR